MNLSLSRREALAGLSAGVATAALSGCAPTVAMGGGRAIDEAEAKALLDTITEHYLALSPESATSLNLDKDARAPLRRLLGDRSQAGQDRFAAMIRADLATVDALDTERPHPVDAHQPPGRAKRLSHRAQGLTPSPMATSRSAGGAIRPTSSARTPAPTSTRPNSSTPTIWSRMPPTPKPISSAWRNFPPSSTANSAASRPPPRAG